MVERANKEVLRHLRAIVSEKRMTTSWSLNLPIVQRVTNTSVHENIDTTPYQILFGNLHVPENQILLPVRGPVYISSRIQGMQTQDAIITKAVELQFKKIRSINGQLQLHLSLTC